MASLRISNVEDWSAEDLESLNQAVSSVVDWFSTVVPDAKWSIGFIVELAQHIRKGGYNVHTIFDEIAILQGTSNRPSMTKPATPFERPPLVGYWHKHHFQARFIPHNIRQDLRRPGEEERLFAPFMGKIVGDVMGEMVPEIVDGLYSRRAHDGRLTGEYIVYRFDADARTRYLTLARHGEDAATASRIERYLAIDATHGNL